MTKSESLKAIDKAFYKLAGCCEHSDIWDKYLALHEAEEKGHRRFKPNHLECGLTKAQSVRLFAVKEVFERIVPAHKGESIFTPEAKDYFSIRGSVFAACAIVDRCQVEIMRQFSFEEMHAWLASVDYVELNKDPRFAKAA